jgi:hypothetical protein
MSNEKPQSPVRKSLGNFAERDVGGEQSEGAR